MIPYTCPLRTQNLLIPHVKFFETDVSFKILSVLLDLHLLGSAVFLSRNKRRDYCNMNIITLREHV